MGLESKYRDVILPKIILALFDCFGAILQHSYKLLIAGPMDPVHQSDAYHSGDIVPPKYWNNKIFESHHCNTQR